MNERSEEDPDLRRILPVPNMAAIWKECIHEQRFPKAAR